MPSRFTYSRWDGTQVGFELDADSVLEEITDDLLYHGDLNAALRRMMQSEFRDRNGERLQGLRDMLEQLRRKRTIFYAGLFALLACLVRGRPAAYALLGGMTAGALFVAVDVIATMRPHPRSRMGPTAVVHIATVASRFCSRAGA